ncbi:very long chain fatty acid elongase AAEL008004-like [Culicoides brevitarsis]|uniref:very long chain fatty acid elongase AAEL008004-like n=1 Tax=Culicoides brevitarsis TaxID=469753 RepID=UPI00307B36E5
MAHVIKLLYNGYMHYFNEYKDPRVEEYPLLGSPLPVAAIIVGYLYFVKSLGPKLMTNRKPFELNNVMMIYNFVQVIANTYLGCLAYYHAFHRVHYNLACQPVKYDDSEEAQLEILYTYWYFLLKLSDLLDTIFFVLRKKDKNISFLHVYHHAGMVFGSYICGKFLPGGHAALLGIINCFVHVIMYFYYFLTSFKPELKKSIWWKKHITQIQLIQFAILIFHFSRPILNPDCEYPKFWLICGAIQNLFMFILFGDFYIKAYLKKPKAVQKPDKKLSDD